MTNLSCNVAFQQFKEGNYQQVEALIKEYSLIEMLGMAAAYSTRERQLSPRISRCILQTAVDESYLTTIIYTADQILNQDKSPGLPDWPFIEWLQRVNRQVIQQISSEEGFIIDSQIEIDPDFLKDIALSSPELFRQIIHYLRTKGNASWYVLGDGFRLTVIERIQRALSDEPRTFWLLIRDAYTYEILDAMARQIQTQAQLREIVDEQVKDLQDSGYQVTELSPGILGVTIPKEDTPSQPTQGPSARQATDEWLRSSSSKRRQRNRRR